MIAASAEPMWVETIVPEAAAGMIRHHWCKGVEVGLVRIHYCSIAITSAIST